MKNSVCLSPILTDLFSKYIDLIIHFALYTTLFESVIEPFMPNRVKSLLEINETSEYLSCQLS